MTNNTEGRDGWIYFILSDHAIKIGFSIEPKRRLESIQISNHHTLEVLAAVPTSLITEREAHKRFQHLRIRGEWFRAEKELLNFIDALKAGKNLIREPTPPRKAAQSVTGQLTALRAAHGANTPMGHACSNLLEQIPLMANYVRPGWATHEMQTLPWLIQKQMKRLSALKAASN